jgi:hypothetical protein
MARCVGLIVAVLGCGALAWLIAGANGFLAQAQQFEFVAGIPVTLLCALAATAMAICGGAAVFSSRDGPADGER